MKVLALLLSAMSTAALAAPGSHTGKDGPQKQNLRFYVGGYDGAIRTFDFDTSNQRATQVGQLDLVGAGPSWLYYRYPFGHTSGNPKLIYATDESTPGHIFVLDVNNRNTSGALSVKQKGNTGAGPVALLTAGGPAGTSCLFTADYNGAAVSIHNLNPLTGALAGLDPVKLIQFNGSGPVTARQDQSYAHQVVLDPSSRFIYVSDLGGDKIHVLALPPGTPYNGYNPSSPNTTALSPGSTGTRPKAPLSGISACRAIQKHATSSQAIKPAAPSSSIPATRTPAHFRS
ncbi:hypothetical protein V8E36_005313 [Tilletia maclaganii]